MIYTGTWFDDAGVPFDGNAKVIKDTGTCGIATYRRRRLLKRTPLPPPYWIWPDPWAPFGLHLHELADEWAHDLPPGDVAAWEADALDGPSKRGNTDRTETTGWIHWNAAHFAQRFYSHDLPSGLPDGPAAQTWIAPQIYYIHVPDQTVNFITSYTDQMADCTHNILAVYQINPAKVRMSNPWRQTRLVHLGRMTVNDPPYYQATCPLQWPVKVGDLVGLYFRGRARWHYNFHLYDTLLSVEGEWP